MRVLLLTTCTPDDRKTLAVGRSLGRAGFEVHVAADRHWGEAFYSRYCRRRVYLPHPANGLSEYSEALQALAGKGAYDAVLPMNDYTSHALAETELGKQTGMPIPGKAALGTAGDKHSVLMMARDLGIAIPRTLKASDAPALDSAVSEIGNPCVIKLNRGAGSMGLSLLKTPDDRPISGYFSGNSEDFVYDGKDVLVQEFIPGNVSDACLVFDRGQCVGGLVQKRLRMYPSGAGVGTVVEVVEHQALLDQAISLLEGLNWHGPAQVEFKIDERDGSARLLEINGRFWGTVDLSVQAGFDVPLMACQIATGQGVTPFFDPRIGTRYRWPFPFAVLSLLKGENVAQVFNDYFRPAPNAVSDLRWTDPAPTIAEVLFSLQRTVQRGFRISSGPAVQSNE